MSVKLIADSGATKCEWRLLGKGKKRTIFTTGISPYFLNTDQIVELLREALLPKIKRAPVQEVHFYGTGLSNPNNVAIVIQALKQLFGDAKVAVYTDMLAAARALCGHEKGVACILGTGSNVCYYNGKKITKNSPGLGYVLGDEGSGAYLGKKVITHYLYNTFDEDLRHRFDAGFVTTPVEILDNVYKKPLPNRYLASFATFLSENRGHYMVENIIADGLDDFFSTHLSKFPECRKSPVHFTGGIASAFRDVLHELCNTYGFKTGNILQNPMEGLIKYHASSL